MIRVTLELVSATHPANNRILGVAEIANDGQQTQVDQATGTYTFKITKAAGRKFEPWKEGEIANFPRKGPNAWHLLHAVLQAAIGAKP